MSPQKIVADYISQPSKKQVDGSGNRWFVLMSEIPNQKRKNMSDINKYRKGYEDMKGEINDCKGQGPADFAKDVVKAMSPVSFAREFFRSKDEQAGRSDALNGKEFDPSKKD